MNRLSPSSVLWRYTLTDRLFTFWEWLGTLGSSAKKKSPTVRLGIEEMEDRVVPTADVWFNLTTQAVSQGSSTTVVLQRDGNDSSPLTVNLGIGADGQGDPQAVWNLDYTLTEPTNSTSLTATGGTATFGAGVSELTFTIATPTATENEDGIAGFRLTIQSGSGYSPGDATDGSGVTDDVQISAIFPVVSLAPASQQIVEGNQGSVWVYRDGGDENQPLTVNLSIGQDGSGDALATWNTNYTMSGPNDNSGYRLRFPPLAAR